MTKSAFLRFVKADPSMYDGDGMTISDKWAQQQELYAKMTGSMGQDYDYRMMGKPDARGHGADAGKLPWHPTFSTQSAFSTPKQPGGVWGHDKRGDTFKPTERMNDRFFQEYMLREEPNVRVIK